jgi:ketosteroid isomerase-like protein
MQYRIPLSCRGDSFCLQLRPKFGAVLGDAGKVDLGDLKPKTRDDPTKALPPWHKSLRVCLSKIMATRDTIGTLLLDDFGMNIRSLFVCGALLLFASVAYGAGNYQRTRDGQTLVWRDVPARGDQATWSGKRDKDGFATGSGVLTWYKVEPTIVTGSNILDTRRYVIMINHYSGEMVRGKFKGSVNYVNANGKRPQASSDNETNRPIRRKKATRTRTARVRATPKTEKTPTPPSKRIIVDTPELTSAPATSAPAPEESASPSEEEPETAVPPQTAALASKQMATPPEPAPEESPSPSTEESQTAVPPQTAALASKQMATPPSEQQVREPDPRSTTVSKPTRPGDSLRSLSAPPDDLPKPPRTVDAETVARLDTLYQSAVKANDVAIIDEILADDFVLVTDRGDSLTKADLIKEAQEKRTIYEHQEVEEGTQKVRIWRDTAVVTALLRIKGTRDQNPFDYKVWVSQTYVRTRTGWRYVFGQPLKPDAK